MNLVRLRNIALGILASACCAATAGPGGWRFVKPVRAQALARETIAAVVLDTDVYAATRADLADLRLRDSRGREVPYLLEKQTRTRTESVARPLSANTVTLRELPGNRIEVVMELAAADATPAYLVLDTPMRDFEKRVSVFGRRHNGAWSPLVSQQPVFDYSRYMDVRNVRVPLPGTRQDRYRIDIDNVTDVQGSAFAELARAGQSDGTVLDSVRTVLQRRDFRIDRIRFFELVRQVRERQAVEVSYGVETEATTVDPEAGRTEILIRAARQPLCGFRLQTTSRNFTRTVQIQTRRVQGGIERWADIGSGQIHKLAFRDISEEDLTVTFAERRDTEYRLLILDHDNPPLEITGIEGIGAAYQLVFLAEPKQDYQLHYGSEEARQPVYDYASVLGALRKGQNTPIRELELGPARHGTVDNGGFGLRALLNSKLVLGLAIGLGVLVLLGAIRFALQRVDALTPPPGNGPEHKE